MQHPFYVDSCTCDKPNKQQKTKLRNQLRQAITTFIVEVEANHIPAYLRKPWSLESDVSLQQDPLSGLIWAALINPRPLLHPNPRPNQKTWESI